MKKTDALDHVSMYEIDPDSVVDTLDPLTIMCLLEEHHDEITKQMAGATSSAQKPTQPGRGRLG
jgi:hypothetical protein